MRIQIFKSWNFLVLTHAHTLSKQWTGQSTIFWPKKKRALSVNVTIYEKKKKKIVGSKKKEIIHAKFKAYKVLFISRNKPYHTHHSFSFWSSNRPNIWRNGFQPVFFFFSLSSYALHFQPDHFWLIRLITWSSFFPLISKFFALSTQNWFTLNSLEQWVITNRHTIIVWWYDQMKSKTICSQLLI